LLSIDGATLPSGRPGKSGGRYAPRKPGPAASKAAKLARKVVRKRK
jgi:hypothetical protein